MKCKICHEDRGTLVPVGATIDAPYMSVLVCTACAQTYKRVVDDFWSGGFLLHANYDATAPTESTERIEHTDFDTENPFPDARYDDGM